MKTLFGFLSLILIIGTPQVDIPSGDSEFKLIIFEGSDWCRNCRRLEKEVLSKEAFTTFLTNHSIKIEKVDFPQRKKLSKEVKAHNEAIAEKYDFEGIYPTIILEHVASANFFRWTEYLNQSTDEIIQKLENKLQSLR